MALTRSTGSSELDTAIENAADKYGVPADALAAIWHYEAVGKYPNPFVNAQGYGGLFGTSQSDAQGKGFSLFDPNSVQDQADQAAGVLAAGFNAGGGDLYNALAYYNSGVASFKADVGYVLRVANFLPKGDVSLGPITIPAWGPSTTAGTSSGTGPGGLLGTAFPGGGPAGSPGNTGGGTSACANAGMVSIPLPLGHSADFQIPGAVQMCEWQQQLGGITTWLTTSANWWKLGLSVLGAGMVVAGLVIYVKPHIQEIPV